MTTSSASITFAFTAFTTVLAESMSFDEKRLSRPRFDSEQVRVTCVWIQVGLEVILLFNVSEMCRRATRAI